MLKIKILGFAAFLCFFSQGTSVSAQVVKNIELEVLGQPGWEMLIPLKDKNLLLLVKTDVTVLRAYFFDQDLNKQWEREVFLDAEEQPKAYTVSENEISLMFSETKGMYYQVFRFSLDSGKVAQSGFELREYFIDQDYVILDDKVLMAGSNTKGAAFFTHHFKHDFGKLIEQTAISGRVAVNLFELQPDLKTVESLWSVKIVGYANEKKKRGEFIRDAFVVQALLDTAGNVLSKAEIRQQGGNFPVDGRLLRLPSGDRLVLGTYQSNTGDKGIYLYDLAGRFGLKTYSFAKLLSEPQPMDAKDMQALINGFQFYINEPLVSAGRLIFGGVFMRPEFKNITSSSSDHGYYPYGGYYGNRYDPFYSGSSRTSSQRVFQGFYYPLGVVLELTETGDLLHNHRIDIKSLTSQPKPTVMAYNEKGSVSYCLRGDLATNNFNIGNKPILYKLSDEKQSESKLAHIAFLPHYEGVNYWYDNYFIANGSRSKLEASSVTMRKDEALKSQRGFFGQKKKRVPGSISQVRKIIYLTKIASGI